MLQVSSACFAFVALAYGRRLVLSYEDEATISLNPQQRRSINGITVLDRMQWFNVHSAPGNDVEWRPEDIDTFHSHLAAHLGRAFVFSSRMAQCKEDPQRPGRVDEASLIDSCRKYPLKLGSWPEEAVDFIHSSKTEQLYPNSCSGPAGQRPKGFSPSSHEAAAEFFALFFTHCMLPTSQERYIIEVANECDVKAGPQKCNTTFEEMIALHTAVANRLRASANSTGKVPMVCGPTGAWPEFQTGDFKNWHNIFQSFINTSSVDCLSMHYYDNYKDETNSSNYDARSGSNLEALLDLQESYSFALRGRVLPLVASEYGSGFSTNPNYSALHDFWILRGVNSKLMQFLNRPDRILKAVPFIVDKATWWDAGPQASKSYPWVLWRNPSGDEKTWEPTHLHKFYEMWREVSGSRFTASSTDANIQVQAFFADGPDASTVNLFVVMNSLYRQPHAVNLDWGQWHGSLVSATLSRLFWDEELQQPVMTLSNESSASFPSSLLLHAEELAVFKLVVSGPLDPLETVDERTLYSDRTLTPLGASSGSKPFSFQLPVGEKISSMRIRISLGGPRSDLDSALQGLHVNMNGVEAIVDPQRQMQGKLHTKENDQSFMGAIEIPVEATGLDGRWLSDAKTMDVKAWSDLPGHIVVSSVVLVAQVQAGNTFAKAQA